MLNRGEGSGKRKPIILEYLRDEDAAQYAESNPFLAEHDRVRKVVVGNSKLLDNKLEKNGAFEFIPKVSERDLLDQEFNAFFVSYCIEGG